LLSFRASSVIWTSSQHVHLRTGLWHGNSAPRVRNQGTPWKLLWESLSLEASDKLA
jgi:hypothetical protein